MAQIQIDLSGKGGLAPRFWGDIDRTVATPELRYLGNASELADGIYNPYRRYGYMSPSNGGFADLTFTGGTPVELMGSSIYDSLNDDFYFAEVGRYIWKGDTLDDTELSMEHDLGATGTPKVYDLEIYQINGVKKLFYVYEKSDNLEVGEATLPITSENDNWLTADVAGAFTNSLVNQAFMRVADNGFAYLFADNNVHKIDGTTTGGTTGTITANVLSFPTHFQIVDAIDYKGNMYMAVQQSTRNLLAEPNRIFSEKVGIYVWDRLTTQVRTRDFVAIEGAREIRKIYIAPNGSLRIITVNSEIITEIRQFDGTSFNIIKEAGLLSYPMFPDSLTTFSNMTVWLGVDGKIYSHGKVVPNEQEAILKIGVLPDTIISSGYISGAILFGGANTDSSTSGYKATKNGLYLSYINSVGTRKYKEWDIYGTGAVGSTTMSQVQGDVYTLVKFLPQMSNVNYIDVYMFPTVTTGSTTAGTIKIYFNQSSTAWATKTITRTEASLGYKRFEINKQYINAIQLEIEFNTSSSVGTSDFAPSFAVVDFTPTKTKG